MENGGGRGHVENLVDFWARNFQVGASPCAVEDRGVEGLAAKQ